MLNSSGCWLGRGTWSSGGEENEKGWEKERNGSPPDGTKGEKQLTEGAWNGGAMTF